MTRVLVIDGEVRFAQALAICLRAHEYEVAVAHSGPNGLAEAAAQRPEVVVLDLALPGMDGLDVIKGSERGARCL